MILKQKGIVMLELLVDLEKKKKMTYQMIKKAYYDFGFMTENILARAITTWSQVSCTHYEDSGATFQS